MTLKFFDLLLTFEMVHSNGAVDTHAAHLGEFTVLLRHYPSVGGWRGSFVYRQLEQGVFQAPTSHEAFELVMTDLARRLKDFGAFFGALVDVPGLNLEELGAGERV